MKCPQCNYPYACPCPACVRRKAGGAITPWITDGENEKCPSCGLTKSLDEWMDEDYRQYQEEME